MRFCLFVAVSCLQPVETDQVPEINVSGKYPICDFLLMCSRVAGRYTGCSSQLALQSSEESAPDFDSDKPAVPAAL